MLISFKRIASLTLRPQHSRGPDSRGMKILTIGFTKKSAETFFNRLLDAGVNRLIDVRLNNVSQLAGFTKKDDLRFFTKAICNRLCSPSRTRAHGRDPRSVQKSEAWRLPVL